MLEVRSLGVLRTFVILFVRMGLPKVVLPDIILGFFRVVFHPVERHVHHTPRGVGSDGVDVLAHRNYMVYHDSNKIKT